MSLRGERMGVKFGKVNIREGVCVCGVFNEGRDCPSTVCEE